MSLRSQRVGDRCLNFGDTAVAATRRLCHDHVFPSRPDCGLNREHRWRHIEHLLNASESLAWNALLHLPCSGMTCSGCKCKCKCKCVLGRPTVWLLPSLFCSCQMHEKNVLHGDSSKRLAPPRNTKDRKHLQSTQSTRPTHLTDQAPSTI